MTLDDLLQEGALLQSKGFGGARIIFTDFDGGEHWLCMIKQSIQHSLTPNETKVVKLILD